MSTRIYPETLLDLRGLEGGQFGTIAFTARNGHRLEVQWGNGDYVALNREATCLVADTLISRFCHPPKYVLEALERWRKGEPDVDDAPPSVRGEEIIVKKDSIVVDVEAAPPPDSAPPASDAPPPSDRAPRSDRKRHRSRRSKRASAAAATE